MSQSRRVRDGALGHQAEPAPPPCSRPPTRRPLGAPAQAWPHRDRLRRDAPGRGPWPSSPSFILNSDVISDAASSRKPFRAARGRVPVAPGGSRSLARPAAPAAPGTGLSPPPNPEQPEAPAPGGLGGGKTEAQARPPSPRGPGFRLRGPSPSLKPGVSTASPRTGWPVSAAAGVGAGRTSGRHCRAGAGVGWAVPAP